MMARQVPSKGIDAIHVGGSVAMRVSVGGCRGSRWIGWMGAHVGSIALSRVYLVLPSPVAHARGMLRTLPCVSARAWIASLVRSLPLLLVRHVWFAFPPTLARVADPRDRSHRGHHPCATFYGG